MTINGLPCRSTADPACRLLDVLREEFGLPGTKEGCGEGECGACAVLVDGQLANSCLVPVGQLEGAAVTTIEGIPANSPVAQAFLACGATQCGICTPGMVMATVALLQDNPRCTREDVRRGLSGNLCRCTGYARIYEAVLQAAGDLPHD